MMLRKMVIRSLDTALLIRLLLSTDILKAEVRPSARLANRSYKNRPSGRFFDVAIFLYVNRVN